MVHGSNNSGALSPARSTASTVVAGRGLEELGRTGSNLKTLISRKEGTTSDGDCKQEHTPCNENGIFAAEFFEACALTTPNMSIDSCLNMMQRPVQRLSSSPLGPSIAIAEGETSPHDSDYTFDYTFDRTASALDPKRNMSTDDLPGLTRAEMENVEMRSGFRGVSRHFAGLPLELVPATVNDDDETVFSRSTSRDSASSGGVGFEEPLVESNDFIFSLDDYDDEREGGFTSNDLADYGPPPMLGRAWSDPVPGTDEHDVLTTAAGAGDALGSGDGLPSIEAMLSGEAPPVTAFSEVLRRNPLLSGVKPPRTLWQSSFDTGGRAEGYVVPVAGKKARRVDLAHLID
eukprot:CAMPEP_0173391168 /NCGR_PEP_ID=MMETSP1356-20130122/17599_1 /TAXON_ID=77927 ORGANISM="Hemiselmis virescens, Strain PCC157" /NCGR_SAMPLE_ID=MMETSP1356 /ASSEMBLY_ACC=CAM_ASM_000847 /LENGTH=345 /DNA_ID=CAMNT_0014348735 /DNA_START=34 /DNA_END=1071 /DNA_ORIENTATION=+